MQRPWNSYHKHPRQTFAAQSNQLIAGKVTPGTVYFCHSILLDTLVSLQIHNQQGRLQVVRWRWGQLVAGRGQGKHEGYLSQLSVRQLI